MSRLLSWIILEDESYPTSPPWFNTLVSFPRRLGYCPVGSENPSSLLGFSRTIQPYVPRTIPLVFHLSKK